MRGFTLKGGIGGIYGGGTHATIEYNIIENNITNGGPDGYGGAISGCDGLIQNNIIRNNKANIGGGLANCNGTIQNNQISGNDTFTFTAPAPKPNPIIYYAAGGALYKCNGLIRNNTIVDNYLNSSDAGGLRECKGTIVNNIIDHTTMTQTLEFTDSSTPTYCLFRDPHAGQGNIAGDPRFVDPAHGDFRLRPDSPAIDAGQSTATLTTDFDGNARGKVWRTQGALGDGSHTDIGAFEFQPGALTLWTPAASEPGVARRPLTVAWALADGIAPGSFNVSLWRGGASVATLGVLAATAGHATYETAGSWTAVLPGGIPAAADYHLSGVSVAGDPLQARSAPFAIVIFNAIAAVCWNQYR